MPVPLHTQTVIAFIWDFDKTLIPGNMQAPLFAEFGVDPGAFWTEVEGLVDYYERRNVVISKDTAYLGHILTYVREGIFTDLSNSKLRKLGAELVPCPGIPDFFEATRQRIAEVPEYAHEGITVEHYVVSTGLRPMIEGSVLADKIDGIWANSFIEEPAPPGYLEQLPVSGASSVVSHVGYVVDNTTKTRSVFEINKGVNKNPTVDVNARMSDDQRRVPIRNMLYIADGPSDVPVFSILNQRGGKTLGVYQAGDRSNFSRVKQLQEQGRVQGLAEADYRPGAAAYLWLMDSMCQIASEIVENRRIAFSQIPNPPGHR